MPVRPWPNSDRPRATLDRPQSPVLQQRGTEVGGKAALGEMRGDDLPRARRFCDKARVEMEAILYAERKAPSDPGRDPHWLCERLTLIQHGAKLARARAVYRSAQDAMSLIHCNGPHLPIDWSQVDGRLIILNKLLSQYDEGLTEVEADMALKDETENQATPIDMASIDRASNNRAAFDAARETLTGLLPFANRDEQAVLHRLIASAEPTATEIASDESHLPQPGPQVSLDAAMPDLVQRLLGHGRVYGKTLSVSYALEGVSICETAEKRILDALWEGLEPRIAADMPLQGVGHIDIAPDQDALEISGSGFAPFKVALEAEPTLEDRPTPPPTPRITPETEDDLRAQLAALLDGGAGSS